MTGDYPELIAESPEPHSELLPNVPQRTASPQSWNVTVAEGKFHWYDLIAGFPAIPDIRDPVGRYMRRMQFDLEAAMEKRLIYSVVTRPRVRFDTSRSASFGFFSLKVSLPLLVGPDEKKDSVSVELEVPFAATLKKPNVTLTENFVIFNWGGHIEALSVHDVLQNFDNALDFPSIVQYVGQTRDPAHRLAKARLAAVQKLHQQHSEEHDTLLLVQRMNVEVISDEGDPWDFPVNQNPVAADILLKDRMDLVECAMLRYFEGAEPRARLDKELNTRRERLIEIGMSNHLRHFRLDLRQPESNKYHDLASPQAPRSRTHVLDCELVDGAVEITRIPDKAVKT